MTERLHFHFSLSCIGEGNGNPLQCSCLENSRDRSLVSCHLWGHTESDTTEATRQQQQQHTVCSNNYSLNCKNKISSFEQNKNQEFASFLSPHLILMPKTMVRNIISNNQRRNIYIKVCLCISLFFRVENSIIKFGYFPS